MAQAKKSSRLEEASLSECHLTPFNSLDHAYWRKKLPPGFQFYMDRLARGILRVQPTNVIDFAAVFLEEMLVQRNNELSRLPEVSYFTKIDLNIIPRGSPPKPKPPTDAKPGFAMATTQTSVCQDLVPVTCPPPPMTEPCDACQRSDYVQCSVPVETGVQVDLGRDAGTQCENVFSVLQDAAMCQQDPSSPNMVCPIAMSLGMAHPTSADGTPQVGYCKTSITSNAGVITVTRETSVQVNPCNMQLVTGQPVQYVQNTCTPPPTPCVESQPICDRCRNAISTSTVAIKSASNQQSTHLCDYCLADQFTDSETQTAIRANEEGGTQTGRSMCQLGEGGTQTGYSMFRVGEGGTQTSSDHDQPCCDAVLCDACCEDLITAAAAPTPRATIEAERPNVLCDDCCEDLIMSAAAPTPPKGPSLTALGTQGTQTSVCQCQAQGTQGTQTPSSQGTQTTGTQGTLTSGTHGTQTPGTQGTQTPGTKGTQTLLVEKPVDARSLPGCRSPQQECSVCGDQFVTETPAPCSAVCRRQRVVPSPPPPMSPAPPKPAPQPQPQPPTVTPVMQAVVQPQVYALVPQVSPQAFTFMPQALSAVQQTVVTVAQTTPTAPQTVTTTPQSMALVPQPMALVPQPMTMVPQFANSVGQTPNTVQQPVATVPAIMSPMMMSPMMSPVMAVQPYYQPCHPCPCVAHATCPYLRSLCPQASQYPSQGKPCQVCKRPQQAKSPQGEPCQVCERPQQVKSPQGEPCLVCRRPCGARSPTAQQEQCQVCKRPAQPGISEVGSEDVYGLLNNAAGRETYGKSSSPIVVEPDSPQRSPQLTRSAVTKPQMWEMTSEPGTLSATSNLSSGITQSSLCGSCGKQVEVSASSVCVSCKTATSPEPARQDPSSLCSTCQDSTQPSADKAASDVCVECQGSEQALKKVPSSLCSDCQKSSQPPPDSAASDQCADCQKPPPESLCSECSQPSQPPPDSLCSECSQPPQPTPDSLCSECSQPPQPPPDSLCSECCQPPKLAVSATSDLCSECRRSPQPPSQDTSELCRSCQESPAPPRGTPQPPSEGASEFCESCQGGQQADKVLCEGCQEEEGLCPECELDQATFRVCESCIQEADDVADKGEAEVTFVSDLPDNTSKSSYSPEPCPSDPAINVNVNVQVHSSFDSAAFLEEVKQHISDAIEKATTRQALSPQPLPALSPAPVRSPSPRLAPAPARAPAPPPPPAPKPVPKPDVCAGCNKFTQENASQEKPGIVDYGGQIDCGHVKINMSFFPPRKSEEEMTREDTARTKRKHRHKLQHSPHHVTQRARATGRQEAVGTEDKMETYSGVGNLNISFVEPVVSSVVQCDPVARVESPAELKQLVVRDVDSDLPSLHSATADDSSQSYIQNISYHHYDSTKHPLRSSSYETSAAASQNLDEYDEMECYRDEETRPAEFPVQLRCVRKRGACCRKLGHYWKHQDKKPVHRHRHCVKRTQTLLDLSDDSVELPSSHKRLRTHGGAFDEYFRRPFPYEGRTGRRIDMFYDEPDHPSVYTWLQENNAHGGQRSNSTPCFLLPDNLVLLVDSHHRTRDTRLASSGASGSGHVTRGRSLNLAQLRRRRKALVNSWPSCWAPSPNNYRDFLAITFPPDCDQQQDVGTGDVTDTIRDDREKGEDWSTLHIPFTCGEDSEDVSEDDENDLPDFGRRHQSAHQTRYTHEQECMDQVITVSTKSADHISARARQPVKWEDVKKNSMKQLADRRAMSVYTLGSHQMSDNTVSVGTTLVSTQTGSDGAHTDNTNAGSYSATGEYDRTHQRDTAEITAGSAGFSVNVGDSHTSSANELHSAEVTAVAMETSPEYSMWMFEGDPYLPASVIDICAPLASGSRENISIGDIILEQIILSDALDTQWREAKDAPRASHKQKTTCHEEDEATQQALQVECSGLGEERRGESSCVRLERAVDNSGPVTLHGVADDTRVNSEPVSEAAHDACWQSVEEECSRRSDCVPPADSMTTTALQIHDQGPEMDQTAAGSCLSQASLQNCVRQPKHEIALGLLQDVLNSLLFPDPGSQAADDNDDAVLQHHMQEPIELQDVWLDFESDDVWHSYDERSAGDFGRPLRLECVDFVREWCRQDIFEDQGLSLSEVGQSVFPKVVSEAPDQELAVTSFPPAEHDHYTSYGCQAADKSAAAPVCTVPDSLVGDEACTLSNSTQHSPGSDECGTVSHIDILQSSGDHGASTGDTSSQTSYEYDPRWRNEHRADSQDSSQKSREHVPCWKDEHETASQNASRTSVECWNSEHSTHTDRAAVPAEVTASEHETVSTQSCCLVPDCTVSTYTCVGRAVSCELLGSTSSTEHIMTWPDSSQSSVDRSTDISAILTTDTDVSSGENVRLWPMRRPSSVSESLSASDRDSEDLRSDSKCLLTAEAEVSWHSTGVTELCLGLDAVSLHDSLQADTKEKRKGTGDVVTAEDIDGAPVCEESTRQVISSGLNVEDCHGQPRKRTDQHLNVPVVYDNNECVAVLNDLLQAVENEVCINMDGIPDGLGSVKISRSYHINSASTAPSARRHLCEASSVFSLSAVPDPNTECEARGKRLHVSAYEKVHVGDCLDNSYSKLQQAIVTHGGVEGLVSDVTQGSCRGRRHVTGRRSVLLSPVMDTACSTPSLDSLAGHRGVRLDVAARPTDGNVGDSDEETVTDVQVASPLLGSRLCNNQTGPCVRPTENQQSGVSHNVGRPSAGRTNRDGHDSVLLLTDHTKQKKAGKDKSLERLPAMKEGDEGTDTASNTSSAESVDSLAAAQHCVTLIVNNAINIVDRLNAPALDRPLTFASELASRFMNNFSFGPRTGVATPFLQAPLFSKELNRTPGKIHSELISTVQVGPNRTLNESPSAACVGSRRLSDTHSYLIHSQTNCPLWTSSGSSALMMKPAENRSCDMVIQSSSTREFYSRIKPLPSMMPSLSELGKAETVENQGVEGNNVDVGCAPKADRVTKVTSQCQGTGTQTEVHAQEDCHAPDTEYQSELVCVDEQAKTRDSVHTSLHQHAAPASLESQHVTTKKAEHLLLTQDDVLDGENQGAANEFTEDVSSLDVENDGNAEREITEDVSSLDVKNDDNAEKEITEDVSSLDVKNDDNAEKDINVDVCSLNAEKDDTCLPLIDGTSESCVANDDSEDLLVWLYQQLEDDENGVEECSDQGNVTHHASAFRTVASADSGLCEGSREDSRTQDELCLTVSHLFELTSEVGSASGDPRRMLQFTGEDNSDGEILMSFLTDRSVGDVSTRHVDARDAQTIDSALPAQAVDSVTQTPPADSVSQPHTIDSVSLTQLLGSLSQTQSLDSVSLTQLVDSLSHLQHLDSVSLSQLADSVSPTQSLELSQPQKLEPSSASKMKNSVSQTRPTDSVSQARPVHSVLQARPVHSVSQTRTIHSVSQSQPEDSVSQTRPVASVPLTRPVDSVSQTQPVDSVSLTRPVDSVSLTRPVDSVSQTRPVASVPLTQPVDSLSQTQPVDSVSQTQPVDYVPLTRPVDSVSQTRPVDYVSQTQPVDYVSQTWPVDYVPLIQPLDSLSLTQLVDSMSQTHVQSLDLVSLTQLVDSLSQTQSLDSVSLTMPGDSVSETQSPELSPARRLDSVSQSNMIDSVSQPRPADSVSQTQSVDSVSQTQSIDSVSQAQPVYSVSQTQSTDSVSQTQRVESVSRTQMIDLVSQHVTAGSVSPTQSTYTVTQTHMTDQDAVKEEADAVIAAIMDAMEVCELTQGQRTISGNTDSEASVWPIRSEQLVGQSVDETSRLSTAHRETGQSPAGAVSRDGAQDLQCSSFADIALGTQNDVSELWPCVDRRAGNLSDTDLAQTDCGHCVQESRLSSRVDWHHHVETAAGGGVWPVSEARRSKSEPFTPPSRRNTRSVAYAWAELLRADPSQFAATLEGVRSSYLRFVQYLVMEKYRVKGQPDAVPDLPPASLSSCQTLPHDAPPLPTPHGRHPDRVFVPLETTFSNLLETVSTIADFTEQVLSQSCVRTHLPPHPVSGHKTETSKSVEDTPSEGGFSSFSLSLCHECEPQKSEVYRSSDSSSSSAVSRQYPDPDSHTSRGVSERQEQPGCSGSGRQGGFKASRIPVRVWLQSQEPRASSAVPKVDVPTSQVDRQKGDPCGVDPSPFCKPSKLCRRVRFDVSDSDLYEPPEPGPSTSCYKPESYRGLKWLESMFPYAGLLEDDWEDECCKSEEQVEMEEFMAYEKAFLEREESEFKFNAGLLSDTSSGDCGVCVAVPPDSGVCTSSQSATCRMECIPEEDEESEGEAGDGDVGPGQQLQPDRVCDMVLCKTYGKSKSSLSDISVEYSRADIVATQLTDVSVPDLSMSDTGMTGVWPCLNTEVRDRTCVGDDATSIASVASTESDPDESAFSCLSGSDMWPGLADWCVMEDSCSRCGSDDAAGCVHSPASVSTHHSLPQGETHQHRQSQTEEPQVANCSWVN